MKADCTGGRAASKQAFYFKKPAARSRAAQPGGDCGKKTPDEDLSAGVNAEIQKPP